MKRFLGLPIFREPLSDEEHVERARRIVEQRRRYAKWLFPILKLTPAVCLLCVVYMTCIVCDIFIKLRIGLGMPWWAGLASGFLFGSGLGFVMTHAVVGIGHAMASIKGDGTEEILVRYHDLLVAVAERQQDLARPDRATVSSDNGVEERSGAGE